MRKFSFYVIVLLVLLAGITACQPETVEVTRVVTETQTETEVVEVTRVVTETVMEEGEEVEVTRVVEVVVPAESQDEASSFRRFANRSTRET